MLSTADVRNLALQRTSSLLSLLPFKPLSPSFILWSRFQSNALLDLEVRLRRQAIIDHTFKEILTEFEELIEHIDLPEPFSIMDIGCGLGLINVFFSQSKNIDKIILVDIEDSEHKHHGFKENGAGYNSLEKSAAFLAQNASGNPVIQTINPRYCDPVMAVDGKIDIIISLISCGFHYPASTYMNVFDAVLSQHGQIILDLRTGVDHLDILKCYRISKTIARRPTYDRVVLVRR